MSYLLDTNTCIIHLNKRSSAVSNRFHATPVDQMAVCSIVKGELFYGAMKSNNPIKTLKIQTEFLEQFYSFPFDDTAAEIYGRIRADLTKSGRPIGFNDLLIAAIALANNLTLVTHNTAEFNRVAGLGLEDWELTP